MRKRYWSITGLFKYHGDRPSGKTTRRKRSEPALPLATVAHDFRQSSSQRLRSPTPSDWQWILQAARFKRETLMMLGLGRLAARNAALKGMRETRWAALLHPTKRF